MDRDCRSDPLAESLAFACKRRTRQIICNQQSAAADSRWDFVRFYFGNRWSAEPPGRSVCVPPSRRASQVGLDGLLDGPDGITGEAVEPEPELAWRQVGFEAVELF